MADCRFQLYFDRRWLSRFVNGTTMASQITSLTIVYIKENFKVLRHWPLWGKFTGERWIPHTRASNAEFFLVWGTGSSRAQIIYWSTVLSCFCFQAICDGPTSLRRGDSRRPSSPGHTRTHCTHPANPGTTTSLLQTVWNPDRLGWTQRQTARPDPGGDRS